jgi:predicted MFS family arabinose efflux permease
MLLGVGTAINSIIFALGPILGGLLVRETSFTAQITITICLQVLALILTAIFVREPRHQQ